tara:strand:- start:26 stop:259 length:234 start_codon:yes stop_codon:yes gene_type:complete
MGSWGIVRITDTYDNGITKIKEKLNKDGLYQRITFEISGDTLLLENFKDGELIENKMYQNGKIVKTTNYCKVNLLAD